MAAKRTIDPVPRTTLTAVVSLLLFACGPSPAFEVPESPPQAGPPKGFESFDIHELGASCHGPTNPETICGRHNDIVGIYVDVSETSPPTGFYGPNPIRDMALQGHRLWVVTQCPYCRISSGFAFVGDLDRMEPGQRRLLQKRLGLAESPLLSTAEEWRAAREAANQWAVPQPVAPPR
jgi:hypothetical protein